MFYRFYLAGSNRMDDLALNLSEYLSGQADIIRGEDELVTCTESFTLRITQRGTTLQFASEDYGVKFKYCYWFDIIISSGSWAEDLMRLVNHILTKFQDDCVLEANGDKPILQRESGELYIDRNIGDGSFPFDRLVSKYVERKLVRE